MPAKRIFSLAEHQIIYEVVKSFNGSVGRSGSPCHVTIQHKIGKTISAPTALDYYRSWNATLLGELKAEQKANLKEALNRGQPQSETVKSGETAEEFPAPDAFTDQSLTDIENQTIAQRVEWVLKRLLKLTETDLTAIPSEKRVRLIGPTVAAWLQTRGLTPEFLEEWLPLIDRMVAACQGTRYVPKEVMADIVTALEQSKSEASGDRAYLTDGGDEEVQ